MEGHEAIEWIHSTRNLGSKLGLENVTELARRMGDPQERFRSVHVAGTNGKGSVCAMLYTVLRAAGYRAGLFTSPYLVDFRERIQADGALIPNDDLGRIAQRVKAAVDGMLADGWEHPTEYEIVAVAGFTYFAERGLDSAVVEVGLGGRLDMTNIISPEICVITPVSMDHMEYLGDTIEKIAYEKAGIIKEGIPVVSAPQEPEAAQVLRDTAAEKGAPIRFVDKEDVRIEKSSLSGQVLDFRTGGQWHTGYQLPLAGPHQGLNALTAVTAVEELRKKGYTISDEVLRTGLGRVRWPGRIEIAGVNPRVVLDGAHNPAGALALREALTPYMGDKPAVLVMGMMDGKDAERVAEILAPMADRAVITPVDNPRSMDPTKLAGIMETYMPVMIADDARQAVSAGIKLAGSDKMVLVTGSLFLIGEIKRTRGHEVYVP